MNEIEKELVGRIEAVEWLDATELQLSYDDGRIVRLYAEDPEGFWAWLHMYVPSSPSDPSVAKSNDSPVTKLATR